MPVHRVLGSTFWLHPITNFCRPTLECGHEIWWSVSSSRCRQILQPLILGVLSHLLIRDWHNCGSCEAISSSLNLIADYHSPESSYSPRSQIPNASAAALAAVAIFPPSYCRWTYWIINKLRSSRTDDVIRLASPRHQLCILDVCQSGGVLSPSRLASPPVLTPTGAANRMPGSWRVSETPLWSASK